MSWRSSRGQSVSTPALRRTPGTHSQSPQDKATLLLKAFSMGSCSSTRCNLPATTQHCVQQSAIAIGKHARYDCVLPHTCLVYMYVLFSGHLDHVLLLLENTRRLRDFVLEHKLDVQGTTHDVVRLITSMNYALFCFISPEMLYFTYFSFTGRGINKNANNRTKPWQLILNAVVVCIGIAIVQICIQMK